MNVVSVRTEGSTEFPSEAYDDPNDKMRNCLLLPKPLLKQVNADNFSYVKADTECETDWEDSTELYVIAVNDVISRNRAGLRTNLLSEIDPELSFGDSICITKSERSVVRPLTVKRAFADEHVGRRCYLHPDLFDMLGIDKGEQVEVFSLETGGRSSLPVWESQVPNEGRQIVSVDGHTRRVLDIEVGDQVGVRNDSNDRNLRGLRERLFSFFVNYRETALRVLPGFDRDEHRNIARINRDMMEFLGIEPGDKVKIRWQGDKATVQCLLPPEGENVAPLSIRLPSTERDRVGVSIYDSLELQRDTGYVFKKQIALSTLGVLGVIIGMFGILDSVRFDPVVSFLGTEASVALFVFAVLLVSVVVIWILLYPERQRCKYHGGR